MKMRPYGTSFSTDDVRLLAENGCGVEIGQYMRAEGIDAFFRDPKALPSAVEAALACGAPLSLHGACYDMNYATDDPLIYAIVEKRIAQSLDIAACLGIGRVVFHSSFHHFDLKNTNTIKRWVDKSIAFWRGVLSYAPHSVMIFLENCDDEDPALLRDIAESIGDARLRICLDIGHANVASALPLTHWIDTLGHLIGHVHIHDNDGAMDHHLPLGAGSIDYTRLLPRLLGQIPLDTPLVLECEKAASLAWLRTNNFMD